MEMNIVIVVEVLLRNNIYIRLDLQGEFSTETVNFMSQQVYRSYHYDYKKVK